MRIAFSVASLLLFASPAFADAVTYKGTLGKLPIVAEITELSDSVVAGRYFYRNVGGDIPLDAGTVDGKNFTLSEEAPCQPGLCVPGGDDGYTVANPPVGAIWSLTLSADGQHLEGTWQEPGKDKTLPIALERVAARKLPMDDAISPYVMRDSASMAAFDPSQTFTAEALPYDFLKMDVTLDEGPVETVDGSSFRYVTDPRTKFSFPRVVSLADGSSPDAMNQALALEHARMNMGALDCLSTTYAGFGWTDDMGEAPMDSLGGYEDEAVQVTYLSPTVMSWNEAGSLFCQEAHPDNHSNSYNYDVRSGQPLDLSKILSGWVIRGYGDPDAVPDPADVAANPSDYHGVADAGLVDWVRSHVAANPAPVAEEPADQPADDATAADGTADEPLDDEDGSGDDCGLDDLIGQYLAVRFETGDKILFTLEGLPYIIFSCTQDLVDVPLADIPAILAPTAAEYFPSLAAK